MTKVTQKDLLDRAVKKLEDQIKKVGGVAEHQRRQHARGAHPRRHQHAVQVHRRGDHHHAAGRVSSGSDSFPSRRRWPACAPNRSYFAMAMQTTSDNAEGEPMMEINTTPLIDVMLVLLIMLIITIPDPDPRGEARPAGQSAQPGSAADRPGQERACRSTPRIRCCGTASPVTMTQLRSVSRHDAADEPGSRSFTCSRTRPRATSWSMRCWPSPRRRTSRRWASSATNII